MSLKTTEFGVVGSATTSSEPDTSPNSSNDFIRFGLKQRKYLSKSKYMSMDDGLWTVWVSLGILEVSCLLIAIFKLLTAFEPQTFDNWVVVITIVDCITQKSNG